MVGINGLNNSNSNIFNGTVRNTDNQTSDEGGVVNSLKRVGSLISNFFKAKANEQDAQKGQAEVFPEEEVVDFEESYRGYMARRFSFEFRGKTFSMTEGDCQSLKGYLDYYKDLEFHPMEHKGTWDSVASFSKEERVYIFKDFEEFWDRNLGKIEMDDAEAYFKDIETVLLEGRVPETVYTKQRDVVPKTWPGPGGGIEAFSISKKELAAIDALLVSPVVDRHPLEDESNWFGVGKLTLEQRWVILENLRHYEWYNLERLDKFPEDEEVLIRARRVFRHGVIPVEVPLGNLGGSSHRDGSAETAF